MISASRLTRTILCLGPGPHAQLGRMPPALLHPGLFIRSKVSGLLACKPVPRLADHGLPSSRTKKCSSRWIVYERASGGPWHTVGP